MMRIALTLLLLLLALNGCAKHDGRTHIVLQRFFGSCDDRYGGVADPAKAEGECGIITTLLNRFRTDNPDVDLKINVVLWPGYDQLTAELAAKDAPDLVIMHASVIPDYQARGLLEPIGPDLARAGIDATRFTPAARKSVTIDGRVWGMPFDNWAMLWHINMNLFRKAGLVRDGKPVLPHSPDEVFRQAERFRRATGKPYFVQITANEQAAYTRNLYTFLMEQGAPIFTDPRHISLETPQARAVFVLFRAINAHHMTTRNEDYAAATASFLNGGGGVMLNGNWLVGQFDAESRKPGRPLSGGYEAEIYPQLFNGPRVRFVDGHNWVMPVNPRRTPAQRAATLRLLRFLADHEADWARTGHLPVFTDIIASSAFQALPHRANYAVLTRIGQPLPREVRRQYPIETIIGEESNAAFSGAKPLDRALADAEHRVNDLLANI